LRVIDSASSLDRDSLGLFGPGSVTWQVDREIVVLLASGARALLMQVAHPLVAAAVADHSRYRSDPIGRLRDTLDAIYSFAFADRQHAEQVVRSVTRLHSVVSGHAPDGRAYSALDPKLLLWVYATLIDTSLLAYETFVKPLSAEERKDYYAEFRRNASLWGIPEDLPPASIEELRAWMRHLIASGEVQVSAQGRHVGKFILSPPGAGPIMLPLALVTVWLLPPELRRGFGFGWGPRRERLMRVVAAVSRAVVPRLPRLLRDLPIARAAERRVARTPRSGASHDRAVGAPAAR
jgi:uncharacterized protein (DUF2236 family)